MYIVLTAILICFTLAEDTCKKSPELVTLAMCDIKHSEYCCSGIKLYNGTIKMKRFKNCFSSPTTTLMSCIAGFYMKDGETEPVPPGYFSPNGVQCIIPCSRGTYCPGFKHNETLKICTHPENDSRKPLNIFGDYKCPGEGEQRSCQKGFYCPTTKVKKPCPDGMKCLRGFSYPLRCNLFAECSFSDNLKIDNLTGLILECVLFVFTLIVLVLRHRLKKRSIVIREEFKNFMKVSEDRRQRKVRSHFNIPAALWSSATIDIRGYRESLPKVKHAFTIRTEDLSFTLKSGRKLLRNANVTFQHSKLNVLMGPSGCGKSTLINSLMGYNKAQGDSSGNLYLNEIEIQNLSTIKYYVGYVTQHDIMHENLTVKEILTYQAQLKLPVEDSNNEYITSSVMEVINLLALNQTGDRVVGSLDDNLISGGQRRRLSIGMELITNPSILILDEPTSGLDSATSLIIMQLLRNLSHQIHTNVICVIHQPRVELFSLFDNLTLLTTRGQVVYNTDSSIVQQYFETLGFNFPENSNPADILIDILSGFIISEKSTVRDLHKTWKARQERLELSSSVIDLLDGVDNGHGREFVETLIDEANPHKLDMKKMKSRGYFDQWLVLLHRECVSNIRSFDISLAEIVVAFLLGLVMAFLFRDISIGVETTKVNLEIVAIGLLVSVGSLRLLGRERSIFLREARSGVHTFSYFFAKQVIHLPTICFFIPVAFVGIYWTASDFKGQFGFLFLLFVLAIYAASGTAYLISVLFDPAMANLISIGFTLIASMFAGCTLTICDLDNLNVIGPLFYTISYARWFVQAALISEWDVYDESVRIYLQKRYWENKYFEGSLDQALWVLFAIGCIFRFLTLMVLFYLKSNLSIMYEIKLFFRKRKERKELQRCMPESHISIRDFSRYKMTETLI